MAKTREIKNQLLEVLEQKNLTLYALAQQTGIRYATLWDFANGKTTGVRYELLGRLCELLDCDVGDLLKCSKPTKRN